MRELKRNLPIRLFWDILASSYENQFYEACTSLKRIAMALDLHKNKKLSAVPLDVVPERRT